MVRYVESLENITARNLRGFFVGWPNPPSPATHLKLLKNSDHVVLAIDSVSGNVIGFVTAISDGVLSSYISFLEVLPGRQRQGIGQELMRRILRRLSKYYMADLICDKPLEAFYTRLGMRAATGMIVRNINRQSGRDQD
jgi:ribosomal protein S18 acetylase RimI-like enzyme